MKSFYRLSAVFLVLSSVAFADQWPGLRGPTSNGFAPEGEFPTEWSQEKNVKWKAALPSRSGATPCVWGDRIFVTANSNNQNTLICLDRSGKKLWEKSFGTARAGKHRKASGSNPSPTTDGKTVFVYYKSGDFAALDFEGNLLWKKNLQAEYGEDTLWWDLGTSPVMTSKHVVIAVMQSEPSPSYLAALDKATGKIAWKVDRELGAPLEAAQSYTTPVVTTWEGQEQIIVLGADHVTAHDASNGKELWRVGGLNPTGHKYFRSISGPVVIDGMVIAPYARGGTITAIKLGGTGDVTKTHIAWEAKTGADVPTPAAGNGRVYVCTDKGEFVCLNAKTGEEVWSGRFSKNRNGFSASPIVTAKFIYLLREDGTTFVLENGDELKIVSENPLEESVVATPVLVDRTILIRAFENLYCIGK